MKPQTALTIEYLKKQLDISELMTHQDYKMYVFEKIPLANLGGLWYNLVISTIEQEIEWDKVSQHFAKLRQAELQDCR